MILNFDNYNGDSFYGDSSNSTEKEIIKGYIYKYDNQFYEEKFNLNPTFEEIVNLSSIGQNIISWYPFEANSKVLEIGGKLGNLTQLLCEKKLNVVTLEPVKYRAEAIAKRCNKYENLEIICSNLIDVTFKNKFDYILVIGNLQFHNELMGKKITEQEYITFLSNLLNDNGKIIFAFNNKSSMKKIFNSTTFKQLNNNNTFSKNEIIAILDNIGFSYTNVYYPLPDYKLSNIIFSDRNLPSSGNIDRCISYYSDNTFETFNEIEAFKFLINTDKNMFPLMTSSYLIEASKNELTREYTTISFNNLRREKYRLVTKISDSYVQKQITNKKAEVHYKNLINNIELLKEKGFFLLDNVENNKIISKYINQKYMLSNILVDFLRYDKFKEFYNLFDKFLKEISLKFHKLKINYNDTVFKKYDINVNDHLLNKMNFITDGFWDMTLTNCFYIDDKFYFFDQEWKDLNVPIEYITFKNIFYSLNFNQYISKEELFEHYQLNDFLDIFYELDNKIQEGIRDEKIWNFYTKNYKNNINNFIIESNEINNKFISYKSNFDKIIFDKDKEIENCNIRFNESQNQIQNQQILIDYLSQPLSKKVVNHIKNMFKGKEKNE